MRKVYLTGASCSGVPTLGRGLAKALDLNHVDCDDFYWLPTDPPFTDKRDTAERIQMIGGALGNDGWVLSGSFDGWGDSLITDVDLIVMVITPTPFAWRGYGTGKDRGPEIVFFRGTTCTEIIRRLPSGPRATMIPTSQAEIFIAI